MPIGGFMKDKYKFYNNRKTRNHPSIEISSNDKSWENMEVTSSPTKNNRYIELKENPNPKKTNKAYVRKYIRKDPIKTRGELLKRFHLSEEDLEEIEKFVLNNKKVSVKPTNIGLSSDKPINTNKNIKPKDKKENNKK